MLQERFNALAKEYYEDIVAVRRHLHMYPELSFSETETSKYICKKLGETGVPFKAGMAGTGIVALIEGNDPASGTVLLRADMDALPIHERNDCEYRSRHDGVMHACGHDVHSACLLGAARILFETRNEWSGTVKLMFQPGEELLPGGASLMIDAGVLNDPPVSNAIALHVFPSLEAGCVGFREGMYMASTDELYLSVYGKGGHAAMPEEYNNPLLSLCEILLELERTFTRERASAPTVLAFGKAESAGATNVIPAEATAAGTFRTMNEQWRAEAHDIMQQIVSRIASERGVSAELEVRKGYPFLVNDPALTKRCTKAAVSFCGADKVSELPLRMTAEDFAFISQKVPSCFFRLGTGNVSRGITAGVHSATFDIDEEALKTGMGLMAWLAVTALQKE